MGNFKQYRDLGVKWGIIMGVVLVLIRNSVWIFDSENAFDKSSSSITNIIAIVVFTVFLAVISTQARKIKGFITSKIAFKTLVVSIAVYAVMGFAVDAAIVVINKDKIDVKMEEIKEETYLSMEEKGLSDEQIEQSMKWFEWFKPSVSFTFAATLLKAGVNILIALIMAQIVKKDPPLDYIEESETTIA